MKVIDTHAQECYLRYREAQDNVSFADLYNALADVNSWHRLKVISTQAGDIYDADSTFDDIVLMLAKRDDVVDFRRLLYVHLRYKRIELWRKNARWQSRVYYPQEYEEFGATADRTEPDRAGFIRELLDRSNEPVAELIADLARQTDGKESISALAGRVGLHQQTAFRALRRLKRYYNADKDGDLAEYLA